MVAVHQVRELVDEQVVEHPVRQGRGAPRDPDRAIGKAAAAPKALHVRKTDRGPAQLAVEVTIVQLARPLLQTLVGWARPLGSELQPAAHDLGPMVALGVRHRRRDEQLQDTGSQTCGHGAAALARGDHADWWSRLVGIRFQDVCSIVVVRPVRILAAYDSAQKIAQKPGPR